MSAGRPVLRELAAGFRMLARGFGLWRRRPGLMWLGLLPAAIAAAVLAGALVPLGFALPGLLELATPFADGGEPGWRMLLRASAGTPCSAAGSASC